MKFHWHETHSYSNSPLLDKLSCCVCWIRWACLCQTSHFLHCCETGPKPKLWHGAFVQKNDGPIWFMVWLPPPKGGMFRTYGKPRETQTCFPSSIVFFTVFVNPGCSKDSTGWRIYKSWGSPTSEQGVVPKLEMTWQRWKKVCFHHSCTNNLRHWIHNYIYRHAKLNKGKCVFVTMCKCMVNN